MQVGDAYNYVRESYSTRAHRFVLTSNPNSNWNRLEHIRCESSLSYARSSKIHSTYAKGHMPLRFNVDFFLLNDQVRHACHIYECKSICLILLIGGIGAKMWEPQGVLQGGLSFMCTNTNRKHGPANNTVPNNTCVSKRAMVKSTQLSQNKT